MQNLEDFRFWFTKEDEVGPWLSKLHLQDDEPMLPDEPAALPPVAPVLPLELTELVDGLALDDEPPLMLPDDEPVLPDEPLAPFWLLAPDCRSLFRPDCWSLPMLLPAP